MTSSALERPRLSPRASSGLPNARGEVFPHDMSHRVQFHTVSSKGTCDSCVSPSSSTYVHWDPRRSPASASLALACTLRGRSASGEEGGRERESERLERDVFRRTTRARARVSMKLDVSDVLYDSSSVSSDSGASQSSRVSHDFLSSIANAAVLPNNVSTGPDCAPSRKRGPAAPKRAPSKSSRRRGTRGDRDARWRLVASARALRNARATIMR